MCHSVFYLGVWCHLFVWCACRLCFDPQPNEVLSAVVRVFDLLVSSSDGVPSIAALFLKEEGAPAPPPASQDIVLSVPKHALVSFPGREGTDADTSVVGSGTSRGPVSSLHPIPLSGGVVDFARRLVRMVVRRNFQDAATVLELYAPFEYLITELPRLDVFLASEPSLEECEDALAEVCHFVVCTCVPCFVTAWGASHCFRSIATLQPKFVCIVLAICRWISFSSAAPT